MTNTTQLGKLKLGSKKVTIIKCDMCGVWHNIEDMTHLMTTVNGEEFDGLVCDKCNDELPVV